MVTPSATPPTLSRCLSALLEPVQPSAAVMVWPLPSMVTGRLTEIWLSTSKEPPSWMDSTWLARAAVSSAPLFTVTPRSSFRVMAAS